MKDFCVYFEVVIVVISYFFGLFRFWFNGSSVKSSIRKKIVAVNCWLKGLVGGEGEGNGWFVFRRRSFRMLAIRHETHKRLSPCLGLFDCSIPGPCVCVCRARIRMASAV